jgi:hypothetical protein
MVEMLRRLTGEPTNDKYTDQALAEYIESYPLLDEEGRESSSDDWEPTYDLHLAAADIWEEKAAEFVGEFDFIADGGHYKLSQRAEAMLDAVRYHRARRTPKSARGWKWPKERRFDAVWIGNLPEPI